MGLALTPQDAERRSTGAALPAISHRPVRSVSIALCVLTMNRPVTLERCLRGITALELPAGLTVDLRIVVVDNDPDGSARDVVVRTGSASPWPVSYAVEPEHGIPFARNRAMSLAGDAELVGFIDDDEVPSQDWLVALLRSWERTGADVVIGPSVPWFEAPPPRWVVEGRFFERTRFTHEAPMPYNHARTSGVLIRREAMPDGDAPFDARFRYSGGSDRHLFGRMHRAGKSFVWVDDAIVREIVPETRANQEWLVRRAYRTGNTRSLTLVVDGAGPLRRFRRAAGGALKALRAALWLPVAWTRGPVARTRALKALAYGLGAVTGSLGRAYEEYRQVHGH